MRTRRSHRTGVAVALAAGLLTAGFSQASAATSYASVVTGEFRLAPSVVAPSTAPVPDPTEAPQPSSTPAATPTAAPTSTPATDPSAPAGDGDVWADVPETDSGGAVEPLEPGDAVKDGPEGTQGPPCSNRTCMMKAARAELANANHNREKGSDNCNFYSGWWGNSGDKGNCPTVQGYRWRTNNWCADFSRYIWQNNSATVTGLDPWAGSFYRANKSNGRYHSKGSGYAPVQGDAVIYDWDGGTASLGNDGWDIDHVGLFEKKVDGKIVVIEGNATKDGQRDGVYRKKRSTDRVVGYISPRF